MCLYNLTVLCVVYNLTVLCVVYNLTVLCVVYNLTVLCVVYNLTVFVWLLLLYALFNHPRLLIQVARVQKLNSRIVSMACSISSQVTDH